MFKKLKNQQGQATIDFLIISMLLFAILFGAIDYWAAMIRIQQAEHIKNYYLDRVRLEGCLTPNDEAELRSKMDGAGFEVVAIDAPKNPVKRSLNVAEGDYPDVHLNITTKFKENPFMLGFFVGRDNNLEPKFSGRVLSEYIDETE